MIGTTLSHFRITEKLGEGGMGEVWRAEDTKLGREVALKVLPEEFAKDPDRMARFEREAKVLGSLNHPNIATLYGLESVSGADSDAGATTFLAMELVDGEDLSERIKRGQIPVDEAIPIALQIADALEAAHEQGIVHRDLKPANIKLADDGVVKVLDFGLAKTWETQGVDSGLSLSPTVTHATAAGVILGTAAYMSPEQARGKNADRRVDIWAFGVVLPEEFSFSKQNFRPVVDISPLGDEMVISADDGEEAMLYRRSLISSDLKPLTGTEGATSPFYSPDGRWIGFSTNDDRVLKKVSIDGGQVITLAKGEWGGGSWGEDETILEADRRYSAPALSPDGKTLAMIVEDENPDIWLLDLERRVLNRLTSTPRSELSPLWFPDGRRLAFVVDDPPFNLYQVPADGSAPPTALLQSPVDSYADAFSADGRWLAVRQNRPDSASDLELLSLGNGMEPTTLRATPFDEKNSTFSPDGRYIAYESNDTDRPEIYIQGLHEEGGRMQLSSSGGMRPRWGRNGELFFWRGRDLIAVDIRTAPRLVIGDPQVLFSIDSHATNVSPEYDVTADGQRFIITRTPDVSRPREIRVVLNWFTELERLAGPGGAR